MANGNDGSSEVGGGGSVLWKVQVKSGDTPSVVPPSGSKRPYSANGKDEYETDEDKAATRYFKVAIKNPVGAEKDANNTWFVYLPISVTRDPDQVKVTWAYDAVPSGLRQL